MQYSFFNRDISWLSFNERVLMEAADSRVPLAERIKFLSIYSSNLDEFYRVRMPVLMALQKIKESADQAGDGGKENGALAQAAAMIGRQQDRFGSILTGQLLPALKEKGVEVVYGEPIPASIQPAVNRYFLTQVLAFLQPVHLSDRGVDFFPENNKLYFVVILQREGRTDRLVMLNIPSDNLPRFYTVQVEGRSYVVFLGDIIKANLSFIFKEAVVKGCYSCKITRDAELEVKDDYAEDMAERIEKQLAQRDRGLATRLLYDPAIPDTGLHALTDRLNLAHANIVAGGVYHNLKDLAGLPMGPAVAGDASWPAIPLKDESDKISLFEQVIEKDRVLHTPYHAYDTVLRFFNEAAIDESVEEIDVTLYRVASDSRIGNALASAARNGKKVTVLVELKARFDEANNIKWAKKLKAAGVKIIYSAASLKVHAKIALVKKRKGNRMTYIGLLATGNLNENTARFYTDHVLLTAHKELLREMELLFIFLRQRKKPGAAEPVLFQHLLVAPFNLQQRLLQLIDREIEQAQQGRPAGITIKLNNLEEEVLIRKLYDASNAGVQVNILVRSICRLVPGIPGMSERITVKRIVDRYLEHGRIFIFHNEGREELYMGSADWMNRNIYRRIEVCFPVYDDTIREEIRELVNLQWQDNTKAVRIDSALQNLPVTTAGAPVRSQEAIYHRLAAGAPVTNKTEVV